MMTDQYPQHQNTHQHQQQHQDGGKRQPRKNVTQEKEGHLLCVDPVSKKLHIPIECISETLAKYRQGVPSLCMLYLNGRCRQGSNCHQVHADPPTVLALREKAQEKMMCCQVHGHKTAVEQRVKDLYQVMFVGGSGAVIPLERCAMTPGLQYYIDDYEQKNGQPTEGPVTICPSATLLCRLHGQDRCRYGDDCKYIHICKELLHTELVAAGGGSGGGSHHQMMNRSSGADGYYGNNSNSYYYRNNNGSGGNSPNKYGGSHNSSLGHYSSESGMHSYSNNNTYNMPSFYPSSPTQQSFTPYPGKSGTGPSIKQLSQESLISMDLTSTPPLTPLSGGSSAYSTPQYPNNKSPVVKSRDAGDSWSYEVYGFNPIPMMPPAMEATA